MNNSRFAIAELVPLIVEVTEGGGEFELYPRGTSMLPLITQDRDCVILVKPQKSISLGDIVLYRRESGQIVLHRVVGVDGDSFTMCGDNQLKLERGIGRDQIIALVSSLKINGKTVDCGSKKYRRWVKRWLFMPYRRLALKLYRMKNAKTDSAVSDN